MTATLTMHTLSIVWLGALLGALATGAAGFAFALAASALWLQVLDPLHTTMLVVACSTLLHIAFVWPMRRTIEPARLKPFLIGGLAGVPIGVAVLTSVDMDGLKLALGAFLLAYGVYALATPRLPVFSGGGRAADAAVGFLGGVLGGIGGYSGVLPTIWTQIRGWPKEAARGVCQPYILAAQAATLALVGLVAVDATGLILFAVTLPALVLGAWAGWVLYGRLDERMFRKLLAAVLAASGLSLLV